MVRVAGRSQEASARSDLEAKTLVQEVVKVDLEVKSLVQEVSQCAGPLAALTALNARSKDRLQRMRSLIERLESCAREQDRESCRAALLADAVAHRRQLLSNQTALRRAALAASLALGARARDALLHQPGDRGEGAGGGDGGGGGADGAAAAVRLEARQRRSAKETLSRGASDITESLMNVSRMMTQQLSRGEETVTTLATSSQVVQGTGEELKAMAGTLHLSHRLITKYRRREVTDRLLVLLALALFLATVAYILKKRIFHFL